MTKLHGGLPALARSASGVLAETLNPESWTSIVQCQ